ncbi:MAG: hypothetical protein AABW92_03010, partial [Nanoarchaeota archaeon]
MLKNLNIESLCDIHIHADNFRSKKSGRRKLGIANVYNPDNLAYHLTRDSIPTEEAYLIYDKPDSLEKVQSLVPQTKIYGWYWLRFHWEGNILTSDKDSLAGLYRELSNPRLQGIKVHPYNDDFELSSENMKPVLEIAENNNLAIIFHSDDRGKSYGNTYKLTLPELYGPMIAGYPFINFVIG